MSEKNLRTCEKGHKFYKNSDCPICPICEAQHKPKSGFLSLISAPARRALENAGINNLKLLSEQSEKDILKLHGIGKTAIPILRKALEEENLCFKNN